MIEKAQSNDEHSEYLQLDLNNIQLFNDKFDIIFSMEVVYYLKNPQQLINHVFNEINLRSFIYYSESLTYLIKLFDN